MSKAEHIFICFVALKKKLRQQPWLTLFCNNYQCHMYETKENKLFTHIQMNFKDTAFYFLQVSFRKHQIRMKYYGATESNQNSSTFLINVRKAEGSKSYWLANLAFEFILFSQKGISMRPLSILLIMPAIL